VSLESLFEFLGKQLALYCGKDLGDLISITLNKWVTMSMLASSLVETDCNYRSAVEATLAIILLLKCEYVMFHVHLSATHPFPVVKSLQLADGQSTID
jgi:hypothetical protein